MDPSDYAPAWPRFERLEPRQFVGCDPGLKGALAAIDLHAGMIWAIPMPWIGKAKQRRANFAKLRDHLEKSATWGAMEVAGVFQQGVKATRAAGERVGELRGLFSALSIPLHEVSPATWRRTELAGVTVKGRDQQKAAAMARASLLHPELPTDLQGDDGVSEALLLAHWARRRFLCQEQ